MALGPRGGPRVARAARAAHHRRRIPRHRPLSPTRRPRMSSRFWISVVVVFVVAMALDFVVHGVLLRADYAALTPNLFRTPEDGQRYFPFMLLAHVFMAIGITWLYRGGRSDRPWSGQGIRFGIALA